MKRKTQKKTNVLSYVFATVAGLIVTFIAEYRFGRVIICKCGYIKVWQSAVMTSENSQHLTDWYTFSHIIHGFAFFYLGRFLSKKITLFQSFILALGIETGWELIENSSFIINRYRTTTMSLDYYGDSIINSSFDILAMVLGFYLAKRLPVWAVVSLIVLMEVGVGLLIRDNLTLNIIMLLYPSQAIKKWQMGM
jgi:hypothetical protein